MDHLLREWGVLVVGSGVDRADEELIPDSNDHFKALPGNVAGKYYVTEACDGCAYCALDAPDNFSFDYATNTYFVSKQPQNTGELEMVLEAIDDCPLDAIAAYKDTDLQES